MKFLTALVLITISAASMASDRSIYDIMYLPNAGTVYGQTAVGYASRDVEGKRGVSNMETTGYLAEQQLGYSITDSFLIFAEVDYANLEDDVAGDKSDTSGLGDPTVAGRFRLLDDNFRFDFIGAWAISTGDSEIKSNGDTDNKIGGHSVLGGIEFGQKLQTWQWALHADVTRVLETTVNGPGYTIENDPYTALNLQAIAQPTLAEATLLRLIAGVSFIEMTNGSGASAGKDYTAEAQLKQVFTPDFMGTVGVNYSYLDTEYAFIESVDSLTTSVTATYQF